MTSEREAIKTALEAAKLFALKYSSDLVAVPLIRLIDDARAKQAARQDWPSEEEAVRIMSDVMSRMQPLIRRGGEFTQKQFLANADTYARAAYRALRNAPQDRG